MNAVLFPGLLEGQPVPLTDDGVEDLMSLWALADFYAGHERLLEPVEDNIAVLFLDSWSEDAPPHDDDMATWVREDGFDPDVDEAAPWCVVEDRALGADFLPHTCPVALTRLDAFWADRKDDPQAPENMTRYHPLHDDDLTQTCLLTGKNSKKKKVYVLVSPWRAAWAARFSWNVNNDDSGGRYARRNPLKLEKKHGKRETVYLYRDIMKRMLLEDPELLRNRLAYFKLEASTCPRRDVRRLMELGIVHHKNQDPEDCRDSNLELVDHSDNATQASEREGASGYVGVHRVSVGRHWKYKATATRFFASGKKQHKTLGVFDTARLALLGRALWLLAHPAFMPATYTPTETEAAVWACAKNFAQGATHCAEFGKLLDLPREIQKLATYARHQVGKGRHTTVLPRC